MQKQNPWFREKQFGWGWCPCSIEGYLLTILFIFIGFLGIHLIKILSTTQKQFLIFLTIFIVLLFTLISWVCSRTGERMK